MQVREFIKFSKKTLQLNIRMIYLTKVMEINKCYNKNIITTTIKIYDTKKLRK